MKYDIILFDVDDTLFDFGISQKNALHNTFTQFDLSSGVAEYEVKYNEISKVLWRELEQGLMTINELGIERFRRLFIAHELAIDADTFNKAYLLNLGKEMHLIPGADILLDNLNGYRLAIITNGFADVQRSRIGSSPISNAFEHIIISAEAGYQKPDRGIFDYTFSKLQITDKSKVLIVGDSLTSDIQGGINYGIDTCWFNPQHKENTLSIKPTYEISELTQLLEVLKN